MRRFTLIIVALMALTGAMAQQHAPRKFDPKQFQAAMEQFITKEAALTPQEAEKFFPVYREMQKKQRTLFDQQRQLRRLKPADEAGCRRAILQCGELDVQIKELQQQYHKRFLKLISARKLFDVLKAEEKYHRHAFKRMTERLQGRPNGHP